MGRHLKWIMKLNQNKEKEKEWSTVVKKVDQVRNERKRKASILEVGQKWQNDEEISLHSQSWALEGQGETRGGPNLLLR